MTENVVFIAPPEPHQTGDVPMIVSTNSTPAAMTPMAMLDRAIASGAGIEVLTKLMDLQERYERNVARKAFDAAIAAAKAEIPVIIKNREGHNSKKFADFAAIARVVDPIISKHGLSYRFRTAQDDRIKVTCVLSHSSGHYEETTLAGPADASGSKNAIQAIGSTLTYLQRYSLVQALGLAASEDDDGRSAGNGGKITAEEVETLRAKIALTDRTEAAFCKYFKVEELSDLLAKDYDRVSDVIERKRIQKVANE